MVRSWWCLNDVRTLFCRGGGCDPYPPSCLIRSPPLSGPSPCPRPSKNTMTQNITSILIEMWLFIYAFRAYNAKLKKIIVRNIYTIFRLSASENVLTAIMFVPINNKNWPTLFSLITHIYKLSTPGDLHI